jgi:hypothetical protein
MSYRQLQIAREAGAPALFESAQRYAQCLWLEHKPARAILALCRAIYLDPHDLPGGTRQPYPAYLWILMNYRGEGFLGNPRISFQHQAMRMPRTDSLKRTRARALWHLTRLALPNLPADPFEEEISPDLKGLQTYLDRHGLKEEGTHVVQLMESLQNGGLTL